MCGYKYWSEPLEGVLLGEFGWGQYLVSLCHSLADGLLVHVCKVSASKFNLKWLQIQVCLQAAASVAKRYADRVAYIDSGNSFSAPRIAHLVKRASYSAPKQVQNSFSLCLFCMANWKSAVTWLCFNIRMPFLSYLFPEMVTCNNFWGLGSHITVCYFELEWFGF